MEGRRTTPLFVQVAETLQGRLLRQLYQPGDLLPPARDLEREFGVSNITIRKALGLLVREGRLVARRGVGTLVAGAPEELVEIEISGDFKEWADSAAGRRLGLRTLVLDLGLASAPGRVRRLLDLPEGGQVWRLRRLRQFKGRAVSYFLNYARPEQAGRLRRKDFRERSFVEAWRELVGVRLARMDQRVRAALADLDLSNLLGVEFGAPLFFVETVYFTGDGRAAAVTHMYYRGDRYVYKASLAL
ncbi:MAG: GntR family transcriptional regulator [Thermodesulfobacteriota bacterium]